MIENLWQARDLPPASFGDEAEAPTAQFQLVDLSSQASAVLRALAGVSDQAKLKWLSQRGKLSMLEYEVNGVVVTTYRFRSAVGLEAWFQFRDEGILFVLDNTTRFVTAADEETERWQRSYGTCEPGSHAPVLGATRETLRDWLGYLGFCMRHVIWIAAVAAIIWLVFFLVSPSKFSWRPLALGSGVGLGLISLGFASLAVVTPRSEMNGLERLGMIVALSVPGFVFGARMIWTAVPGPLWAYLVIWLLCTLVIYPAWDEYAGRT